MHLARQEQVRRFTVQFSIPVKFVALFKIVGDSLAATAMRFVAVRGGGRHLAASRAPNSFETGIRRPAEPAHQLRKACGNNFALLPSKKLVKECFGRR